jgi:hypothetical protein
MRNHLGISFTVWNRRQTWFWLVPDQHGNGGAIGTAASEAEAVREACSSIEEKAPTHPHSAGSRGPGQGMALVPVLNRAYPCQTALGWMDWWMSIADQVTDRMFTRWAHISPRSS